MPSTIKVYAGLSAQRADVHAILPDALYAAPVQRGDITADIENGITSILILDGLFHQALSVSPSEIMDALRRGVRIFGASSMGALRAAELESHGMVGVGDIFEHIRDADAFRDDFLGQVFIEGWPQIQEASVTYVEFEINLKTLLSQRRISRKTCDILRTLYAELHYAQRDLKTLEARIRVECRKPEALLSAATKALATMTRPKHRDARKAMELVSRYHNHVGKLNAVLTHPLNASSSQSIAKRQNGASQTRRLPELAAAYPASDLLQALQHSETVEYRENGNRAAEPTAVLKKLEGLMSLVGATRLAEISQLATHGMPVYQSTRPVPFGHTSGGTTTGAQGKGPTPDQARISCLAETVEGYCLEPRNEQMIRASYGFLRRHHAVADPRQFTRAIGERPLRVHEPLMWTEALCLEQKTTVLVPAELVFFDFFAADYNTRAAFPCSTHGAGAGSTYLEAATHALYECIEGHYEAAIERGEIRPLRVRHTQLEKQWEKSAIDVRLYSMMLPGIKNLPFIYCMARTANSTFAGSGCFSNLDTTVMRAVSEALQTISTSHSGSREDLGEDEDDDGYDWEPEDYAPRNISIEKYRSRILTRQFRDLRAEFRFLLQWLHTAGFPVTYMANLTRRGIEFPVVKAIVPGMMTESSIRYTSQFCSKDAMRHSYGTE